MTVEDLLRIIETNNLKDAALKVAKDGFAPARSVSVRFDDTGDVFLVIHETRASGKTDLEVGK